MELPGYFKNVKAIISSIVGAIGVLTALWAVSDRLVTDGELQQSEERVIAEVRNESASIRVVVIEDMEARLDDLNFEINMAQMAGEQPNEALIIKRNTLERRIEKLKANEDNPGNNP